MILLGMIVGVVEVKKDRCGMTVAFFESSTVNEYLNPTYGTF